MRSGKSVEIDAFICYSLDNVLGDTRLQAKLCILSYVSVYVCDVNVCFNAGTCSPDLNDSMSFTCECLVGYHGQQCDGKYNPFRARKR